MKKKTISCPRRFPGVKCYGVLVPHEVGGVLKCSICWSLYTKGVLKELGANK